VRITDKFIIYNGLTMDEQIITDYIIIL